MKLNKENKRGISLIVLVITIIVMIILAAAIILSLNSSGIIGKANEATKVSDMANAKNVVAVAKAEWTLEKVEGYDDFSDYAMAKLEEAGFKTSGRGSYEVTNDGIVYAYPTIPVGFTVSIYEGEQNILDGLVIYETDSLDGIAKETAMETYNQYVWVPVGGTFERISWVDYFGNYPDLTNIYIEPLTSTTKNMDDITKYADEIAQYNAMKKSVEINGGFYIARYEAGKETINGVETAVSKKNADVWNNIKWDTTWSLDWSKYEQKTSIAYGDDSQDGAAKEAKASYTNAERHLIYGIQWDATINFMKDVDNPNSATGKKYIYDSTGMGWHYNNYAKGNANHKTGIDVGGSEQAYNKVKNIYDLAGNVHELTYEVDTRNSYGIRVVRGSDYDDSGLYKQPSNRSYIRIDMTTEATGFRMALYIK